MSYSLQYFLPSKDELTLATQLLEMNSWNRTDSLSVDTAIGIFKQSGISFKQLREIWSIADKDGSGELSREELAIVIRLMGWLQAGETMNESLLSQVGPLPKIKGIPDFATPHRLPTNQPTNQPPKVEVEFPLLTIQNALDLYQAFLDAHPVNGTLQNRMVMEIFMRLKPDLSFETLFRIMQVVEKNEFGEIGFQAFAIGMHIVRNLHIFPISSAPISVPAEIYITLDAIRTKFPEGSSLIASSAVVFAETDVAAEEVPTGTSDPIDKQISLNTHHSTTLPAAVNSDIQKFMRSLATHQCIDGHAAAKFMSTYKVMPVELAEIWRKTDFGIEQRLSTSRLALIEELVRAKIFEKIYQGQPTDSPPPSYHTSPTEQGVSKPQTKRSRQKHHDSSTSASLSSVDPPEYQAVQLPVATSIEAVPSISISSTNPPSSALNQRFLNGFQDQITRLTAQLETVSLEQTATQSDLRNTVKSLQEENIQLRLREQELQAKLARKEVEHHEAEQLTESMRFEFSEMGAEMAEFVEESERLEETSKNTIDIQSKQIASLLELVSSLESTIKVLHLNPEQNDLRLGFLRASARESQAATAKATSEAGDLRQKVIQQEQEITELRGRLEEKNSSLPVSLTSKDLLLALREDHEALKAQVEQLFVQRTLPPYVPNDVEVGGNELNISVLASSPVLVDTTSDFQHKIEKNSSSESFENRQQPSESNSRLEYDLGLLRSDFDIKGYMGGSIIQRFISEYGLDASFLDEICRLTNPSAHPQNVDATIKHVREAVISGRERFSHISSQFSTSSSLDEEDKVDQPGPPFTRLLPTNRNRFSYLLPKTIRESSFKAKISNPRSNIGKPNSLPTYDGHFSRKGLLTP